MVGPGDTLCLASRAREVAFPFHTRELPLVEIRDKQTYNQKKKTSWPWPGETKGLPLVVAESNEGSVSLLSTVRGGTLHIVVCLNWVQPP
uniref:Uncharacterized protein n=2 Tax=Amphimedon queenslandica TaxID=400682 RepID=A0A1X7SJ54_AMPQE